MNTPSDRALLERALAAIEQVMGKRDAALDWGVPVGTAAHEATSLCLTAASALVDVAQTLLRQPTEVMQCKEVPTKTGQRAAMTREARAHRRVLGDGAAQSVTDEGLDGVGFVEGHFINRAAWP